MEGYKDSPLGKIPQTWKVVKLSDVCLKIGDGLHSTPKYVDNSQYYFVNGNNLVNGNLTVSEKTKCVSKEEYEKLRIKLNRNSILMSINGTIGNIALYKNEEVVFGKSASFISPLEESLNYKFLFYFLQNSKIQKYYFDELTGSTIKNLSLKSIRNTPTLLPPLPEQQKIAEILSTVDAKIEVIDQQITETQALKKGLMQRLLTKGIGHTEFKDSPLGEIPKSWEVVKLSDVCYKIGDGIHSTPKYVDISEYYFVNGNNLVNGTLTIFEKTKCVSKEEYDKLKIKLNKNTVLMSINGTIGNLALYQNEEVIFGKSASYISVNEDVFHYLYLYYFLQHSSTKKYFFDELTGSTIQNLSLKTIRNTPTLLPSISEQKEIASVLSTIDDKLEVLSEKKTHYQELKQGLMQQLLTGKVRVNTNENVTA
jgi:type I restriction enzyme S subunit